MECKSCGYRLWNLASRQCPECGQRFKPSEYAFVTNSVQYCCLHCGQSYYGTGENGHLEPAAFTCVSCDRFVQMDEMVLLPTENVSEQQTQVHKNPWLVRLKIGFWRGWFSTVGLGIANPNRLIESTPKTSSVYQAFSFLVVTCALYGLIGAFPIWIWVVVMMANGGIGLDLQDAALLLLVFGGGFLLMPFWALLWGLTCHFLLRLTGPTASTLSRTYQSLAYSSGVHVLMAVPCVSCYMTPLSYIWWSVTSIFTVTKGQQVHPGRAAFAVLSFPMLIVILSCTFLSYQVYSTGSGWSFSSNMSSSMALSSLPEELMDYAHANQGQGPDHVARLMVEAGLYSEEFVAMQSSTYTDQVPLASTTLDQFESLSVGQQQALLQQVVASLPTHVVAHRLGDYVFTYHGIDWLKGDPGLWVVIESFDPDIQSQVVQTEVAVTYLDGRYEQFPSQVWPQKLQEQNQLRAQFNLPPLPDPATVRHGQPAVSP